MSQHKLTPAEAQLLQESINSDPKTVNIRLRKGEYQYDLAKGIATFQLERKFPDVKELTETLYGEEKADETPFIRKIQTILKKMEKSDIVKILPKKEPWELQRYALLSFKFQDVDQNLVALATPQQIKQTQNVLRPVPTPQDSATAKISYVNIKILISAFIVAVAYTAVLWSFLQPIVNLIVFVPALYIAVACSLVLGKLLSHK